MREASAPAGRIGAVPSSAEPLFLRACRGEVVERPPIWIMRQAGRYLPEYRSLRERHDFLTCCRTPEIACEITLQPIRRLGVDAAILFSDILVPLPGMGVDVAFEPGPRLSRTVRTAEAVAALRVPDPLELTPYVLDTVRLLRRELPASVPLIGFAGAPFTMATYLVEGGGSKTFSAVRTLLHGEPATLHHLLRLCTETVSRYLAEQVRAGAHAAMLFDTWAGLLPPADVGEFVIPYARDVLKAVRHAAPAAPTIYYAGECAGWIDACAAIGADVIGVDWRQRLDDARRRLGTTAVLQGNLDPAVLLGGRDAIRQRAQTVLAEGRPPAAAAEGVWQGHVFNLGHGILPETPPEHAQLLVETIREAAGGPA